MCRAAGPSAASGPPPDLGRRLPPLHDGPAEVAEYLVEYASFFRLEQHVRFNTTVRRVLRDERGRGWVVDAVGPGGDAALRFDKIVFSTGSDSVPSWPPMPGRDLFRGTVLHAQSYRRQAGPGPGPAAPMSTLR